MIAIVTIFKALADDTRLRVLKLLGRGELCVCEIAAALDMEQPRLSFHLRILKEAGIVQVRRQERWILYRLNEGDLFIRFLLLAIAERISAEQAGLDRKRLAAFGGREKACAPQRPAKKKGRHV
ncbi:MAG: metalloregulator ArsR/SmtB family transcription factor [Candidatus Aminicenantes bacterium]|nr:metalloregulator ArsR/SmtB family transcription factor [Candidatus Aminicenantes bacterium]